MLLKEPQQPCLHSSLRDSRKAIGDSCLDRGEVSTEGRETEPTVEFRGPPLGTSPEVLHPQNDAEKNRKEKRAKRYEAQAVARGIFINEGVRLGLVYPSKFHRTAQCLRKRVAEVTVYSEQTTRNAFYGGLLQCGSVWSCCCCSHKIANRRAEEIKKAVEWAYANNLKAVMVTLTFPHKISDTLKDSRSKFARALKSLRQGKAYDSWKKNVKSVGMIRSWELLHGLNSWHLHSHELMFVDKNADSTFMYSFLAKRWEESCVKAGLLNKECDKTLESFRRHALHIVDNAQSSDYLVKYGRTSKWGVDAEMAKGARKKSSSGVHPFEWLEKSDGSLETKKNHELFLEYSIVMKGARQLYWSSGLKAKCGVQDKTDEEIVEEKVEKASVLARLSTKQWDIVKEEDARTEILDLAETQGFEGLKAWFLMRGEVLRDILNDTEGIDSQTGPPVSFNRELIP